MKILIIEDEFNLADAIKTMLSKKKYDVTIKTDGEEGLDEALTNVYDLIILDVMLPSIDGFDILNGIKEEGINSKVLMLTAKKVRLKINLMDLIMELMITSLNHFIWMNF